MAPLGVVEASFPDEVLSRVRSAAGGAPCRRRCEIFERFLAGGQPADSEASMLLVSLGDGAAVAACDPQCLAVAAGCVDIRDVVAVDPPAVCSTCYSCGLTVEGRTCPCRALGVSCSGSSWLLTSQAAEFLEVLYEMCGPYRLTDDEWAAVTGLAEGIWAGGVVAALWVLGGGGRSA
ncbi:hypothetical protein [Geodermatophilus sp. SYSU D00698]